MSWVATIGEMLDSETERALCQAGHAEHQIHVVDTEIGKMVVFDGEHHQDTPGYCPGDDDVSRTLNVLGRWEPDNTSMVNRCLQYAKGDTVIDIGCHVGWYSIIALAYDKHVLAIDAQPESLALCRQNVNNYAFSDHFHSALCWVDETTAVLPASGAPDIALVKIDIEGNEQHAVNMLGQLLHEEKIENIMLECSPTFNGSYAELLGFLVGSLGFHSTLMTPGSRQLDVRGLADLLAHEPQFDLMLSRDPSWWSL